MSENLDENDPFYASKKWGPNYRTKDAYWEWRHAREDRQRAETEGSRRESRQNESNPYFVNTKKEGW